MEKKKSASRGNQTALLGYFLQGSIRFFVYSMLFALLVSWLDMIGPRIISFTVDSVIGNKAPQLPGPFLTFLEHTGGVEALRLHPWRIALIVAAVALAAAICRFLFRFLNRVAAEKFVRSMRDKLYRKIQHLPYFWHGENAAGDIIQRCTSDVETIKVFVSEQLTSLVRIVVLIAMAVTFMAGINVKMTVAASLFIPVIIGYSLIFYAKIGSTFEEADEQEGKLSSIAQENLTGIRVVRAFGREMDERTRFEKQNTLYTGIWIRLIRILTLYWVTGDIMTGVQYLLVNVMGAAFCISGHITAGQFIAFVSYNAMLSWPVRMLGRVISEMSKAGISLDRLSYIMREAEEYEEPKVSGRYEADQVDGDGFVDNGSCADRLRGDISFHDVSFRYPGGARDVLSNVSFTVRAGTTTGILGSTGSGKSTLMYLLERLYDLENGRGSITIGGTNITDIDKHQLRANIGMVLQEPFLFSRTLEENIAIAAPNPDHEEVRRAAQIADLDETISRFPSGYNTFVGERGVTLSGGQKQRTAIARMLIRKCPVMIFDDSLSAVDAQTDEHIRRALQENTAGATVILIAHRVSTLMHADQILVMDQGKIAERGTHEELIRLGGMYKKVYDLQTGGDETDE